MKKTIIILVGILFFANTLIAQDTKTDTALNKIKLKLNVGGGFSMFQLDKFNEIATANNFPTLADGIQPVLFLGVRLDNTKGKVSGDATVGFIRGSYITGIDYEASHTVYNFDVNVAYTFMRSFKNHIYGGLGLGFLTHRIKYFETNDLTFGQSMQLIGGERSYASRFNYYLNPRINYDYNLSKTKYLGIGIFVGYRVGINNQTWKVGNNTVLPDAPTSNASGFYAGARLTI